MTIRQAAAQGVLALLALAAAYFTWQRHPELAADEVVVLDIAKSSLLLVRFDDKGKSNWVELTPASDENGSFVAVHLSGRTTATTTHAAEKTQSVKTPERTVRGSDSAAKLFASFAPLHASRSLGILDESKQKDLGLSTSEQSLTVTFRGGSRTFTIAAPSPGGAEPYLRDKQDGRVYLTGRSLLSDFQAAASVLVERRLHNFRMEEVDRTVIIRGAVKREFLVAHAEDGARFAPAKNPDKPDAAAKSWHDQVFGLWPQDVLGKDEIPSEGTPQTEIRVNYLARGRLLGWLEIGKVASVTSAKAEPQEALFARSEHTLGWIKIGHERQNILTDAEQILH